MKANLESCIADLLFKFMVERFAVVGFGNYSSTAMSRGGLHYCVVMMKSKRRSRGAGGKQKNLLN